MEIEAYEQAKRASEAVNLVGAEDWRRNIRDQFSRIRFANPIPDHVLTLLRLTCNNLYRCLLRDGYRVERPPRDPIEIIAWLSETENPQHGAGNDEKSKVPTPGTVLPDNATLSPRDLAITAGVDYEALRQRLNRLRRRDPTCCIENPDRKPTEALYLYKVASVLPMIEKLKASSKTSSNRTAEE